MIFDQNSLAPMGKKEIKNFCSLIITATDERERERESASFSSSSRLFYIWGPRIAYVR